MGFSTPNLTLSPGENSLTSITDILQKLEPYYDYHGIDLRHCFEDFARHNNGIITASQFERSFPGKDIISITELKTLTQYYVDPFLDGRLVNYLNFHLDINRMRDIRKTGPANAAGDQLNNLKMADDTDENNANDGELKSVFDRLHVAIFKNRIRTTEFFKDNDKLRSGIITRNQFIRGLALAQDGVQLGASLLTTPEINKIADFYSDNGFVSRKFWGS